MVLEALKTDEILFVDPDGSHVIKHREDEKEDIAEMDEIHLENSPERSAFGGRDMEL